MEHPYPATVLDAQRAGARMHLVTVKVPEAVKSGFVAAGQFLKVKIARHHETILAMASAPGNASLEFLVRDGNPLTELLAKNEVPSLEVSAVQGRGFPLGGIESRSVLFVGTGTGIGPLRSLIRQVQQQNLQSFQRLTLVYGTNAPVDVPLKHEADAWSAAGMQVVTTLTKPGPTWTGGVGRVQQQLLTLPLAAPLVFLCGQADMVTDCRQLLERRGVASTDIHVNF